VNTQAGYAQPGNGNPAALLL